jgi:hypothetical protein
MARNRSRNLRRRLHALERRNGVPEDLTKSTASMATLPVPRTSSSMMHPIYQTQVPVLEPFRPPELFGAYQRGRLWNSYGGGVSFEMLRLAARRCLLLQAIHQMCQHDMLQLSKHAQTPELLGWRIQHSATEDETVDTDTPEIRSRIARITRQFEVPHPVYEYSFRGFLSRIMDDYLTLNRVAIELIRNPRGKVVQFRTVDAATILPTYRVLQRYVGGQMASGQPPLAYDVAARVLERETGYPILDSEYVCVMRGQLVGTFAPGELLVWEDMPITDVRVIFPPSYVEKALEGIISWLYAFHYNRTYFSQGNPIEVILGIAGDIQDDSFVALEDQLRENFSGIKGAWRVPLVQLPVDGMLSVVRLKENHREMQFSEWMATLEELVCAIYRVSRRRVNADMRGQSGSLGVGQARQEEIESSKEESFRIHRAFLEANLTYLVHLFDPDLEFTWTGLDAEDRSEEIKIEIQEMQNYRSIDEIRLGRGEEPYKQPWAEIPMNALVFQAAGLTGAGSEGSLRELDAKGEQDEAADQRAHDHEQTMAKQAQQNGMPETRSAEEDDAESAAPAGRGRG